MEDRDGWELVLHGLVVFPEIGLDMGQDHHTELHTRRVQEEGAEILAELERPVLAEDDHADTDESVRPISLRVLSHGASLEHLSLFLENHKHSLLPFLKTL